MFNFPKHNRLLKHADFQTVMNGKHQKIVSPYLVVIACGPVESRPKSRVGIIASRKYGNSVQRNDFKRAVREEFRHQKDKLKGVDIVVIARHKSLHANAKTIGTALTKSLQSFF